MPDGSSTGGQPDVTAEALAGLLQTPKTLPPKLFYDDEGCRLFVRITELPEYYPTRTERALLHARAADISACIAPQARAGTAVVEYGACNEEKAAILLASLEAGGCAPRAYVPIDVAEGALASIVERMRRTHPGLALSPLVADFEAPLDLPQATAHLLPVGFFPGSTVGNLEPAAARRFLASARTTLGAHAFFVVGVDLRKSPDILVPAYDDAAGVTAAFNINLLVRLNREAGADFDPDAFVHRAVWNERESRIEMHLVSRRAQTVSLAGHRIHFAEGESIHTENSYKHTVEQFCSLAGGAGWRPLRVWVDDAALFSLHLLAAGET